MTAALSPRPGLQRKSLLRGGLLIAFGLLVLAALASFAFGNRAIAPGVVLDALLHYDPANFDHSVVVTQRLPRTLLGIGVGAAFGLGGALMQALTRNPLADPGLLGVNAGAALAIVASIVAFGWTSPGAYVWVGMLGAAATAMLVYRIGTAGRTGANPVQLALAGTAITALIQGGLIQAVLLIDPAAFDTFRSWDVGSIAGRDGAAAAQIAPFLVVGIGLALALAGPLNALALGEETATALGTRVGKTRLLGVVAVTLLCGAATAAAGPVGFVGLVIPFLVRSVTGPDQRWILTYSVLLSPVLLLGADTVGRVVLGTESELPVGLVTALIGAPVFIVLVRRRKVAQL